MCGRVKCFMAEGLLGVLGLLWAGEVLHGRTCWVRWVSGVWAGEVASWPNLLGALGLMWVGGVEAEVCCCKKGHQSAPVGRRVRLAPT